MKQEKYNSSVDENLEEIGTEKVNETITLIERLRKIKWSSLFDGALKLFLVLIILIFVRILANPRSTIEYLMEIQESIKTEQHTELMDKRIKNSPRINSYLKDLFLDAGTNRAFIIEFHNGNNNMSGLPFYWGDMTYEATTNDVDGVKDNWYSISLTRYNFILDAFTSGYFIGDINQVRDIDPMFAKKMELDNITYIGIVLLFDNEGNAIGCIGVSYDKEDYNEVIEYSKIAKALHKYNAVVQPLLTGELNNSSKK